MGSESAEELGFVNMELFSSLASNQVFIMGSRNTSFCIYTHSTIDYVRKLTTPRAPQNKCKRLIDK